MFEQIRQSISQFISLNEEESDFFFSLLSRKELKKKELLIRSGQSCRNIYFINKGCIRYYYLVAGEEKTAQFFFENGWYTDYESFLSGDPSENFVDAIEDTDLLCLEKSNLEKLYSTIPKFERFGRIVAENAYLGIRHRTKSLTNLTAEERYLKLIKERPKIFDRVPQYYVASYLNIKPQSLSRIRKNIAKGGNG